MRENCSGCNGTLQRAHHQTKSLKRAHPFFHIQPMCGVGERVF